MSEVPPRRERTAGGEPWLLAVAVAFLASLPRMFLDYGLDGDAWAGVRAGREWFATGAYSPSRLPGNPLFEGALALLDPLGGPAATNLFVFGCFLIAAAALARLARRSGAGGVWGWLLALTPVLVVSASTTIDYCPGIACVLWAFVMALEGRAVAAALLMTLALGCRLPHLALIPALLLQLRASGAASRRILLAGCMAAGLTTLVYVPVLARYGIPHDLPASGFRGAAFVARVVYKALWLLGPAASLVIGIVVGRSFLRRSRRRASPRETGLAPQTLAAAIAAEVVLFAIHPDESEYLLPAVPFLYLWLSRILTRRESWAVAAAVLSFHIATPEFKGGTGERRALTFRPAWGITIQDARDRRDLRLLRREIADLPCSEPALVMTGLGASLTHGNDALEPVSADSVAAALGMTNLALDRAGVGEPDRIFRVRGRRIVIVYALSRANVERARSSGAGVWVFSEHAPALLAQFYGYGPSSMGLPQVPVFSRDAFYRRRPG